MPKSKKKNEPTSAKRAVGRPSLYEPTFCERVVALGAEGKSPVQIAVALGCLRENLYDWARKHPEFSTALRRAKEAEQNWWETKGAENLGNTPFQAQVWRTSMQARFREDYTERRVNELTGPDGGPIKTEHAVVDASDLDPSERAALRAVLKAAKKEKGE